MSLVLQDKLVLSPETAEHLQEEIDTLEAATDVADVIATKADLDNYDKSKLTDQAIVKVLCDSTHNDAQAYYRYTKSNNSFTYIGSIGPYVELTTNTSRVYGTDNSGNQTTYDKNDFGKVDDVKVDNVSVVTNKIANIDLSGKQDTLVNQTNIKSVNGNSLLGSGNLELTQYLGFPSNWPTTNATTTKAFCDAVAADTTAIQGKMYLGEVRWSDLPANMVNAEVTVSIMYGSTQQTKVIVLEMTSGNQAPYQWQYTYWNGGSSVSGWKGFQEELPTQSGNSGKFLTTNGSSLSWGTVDALPSQTGEAGKFLSTNGTSPSWEDATSVTFRTWEANE